MDNPTFPMPEPRDKERLKESERESESERLKEREREIEAETETETETGTATEEWFGDCESSVQSAVPEAHDTEREAETMVLFADWDFGESDSEDSVGSISVYGESDWDRTDVDRLGDLKTLLWKRKAEEFSEVALRRQRQSHLKDHSRLDESDFFVKEALDYRKTWEARWAGAYGSFDDTTGVMPMKYTHSPAPENAWPCDTLQIYSVKVAAIQGEGLQWPLHVFGMVAVRDCVCRNRNLVFNRKRRDCQILTEEYSNLVLIGPTRPVVAMTDRQLDFVMLEVDLKVKGNTEDEDKYLSFVAVPLFSPKFDSQTIDYATTQSTLQLTLGKIQNSVEATIFIRVKKGSWPLGFHGLFAASTSGIDHEIVLLDFDGDKVPANGDGYMVLNRSVVSVEENGSLKVSFCAWHYDNSERGEVVFKAEKLGRSYGMFHLNSCELEVLVAWSLISPVPRQPELSWSRVPSEPEG